MPDYNLFGLNARSFEQLVQALGAKIIGPNIVVFGDGPDGAREATFSGKIDYPTESDAWNGNGIIQAKFLQKSSGKPKQDADWLLRQLATEMKKFSKPASKKPKTRQAPEYYLLVTNVFLSAKGEKGGRDRLDAAMNEYKRNLGWKAWEIWDGEKISRILDGQRDIATTYAAWITAGDVLKAVMDSIRPRHPEFPTVMFTFLQKELLSAQYANLRQAGHSEEERVSLSRVFVDLAVTLQQCFEPPDEKEGSYAQQNRVAGFITSLFTSGGQRLAPSGASDPISSHWPNLGSALRSREKVLVDAAEL